MGVPALATLRASECALGAEGVRAICLLERHDSPSRAPLRAQIAADVLRLHLAQRQPPLRGDRVVEVVELVPPADLRARRARADARPSGAKRAGCARACGRKTDPMFPSAMAPTNTEIMMNMMLKNLLDSFCSSRSP